MVSACSPHNVSLSALQYAATFTTMCKDADSYTYYDLNDPAELAQCRFTWNWEYLAQTRYCQNGCPFPNKQNPRCGREIPLDASCFCCDSRSV